MKIKPFAVNTVIAVSLLAGSTTLSLATDGEVCDKGAKQAAYHCHEHGEQPLNRLPMYQLMNTLNLNPDQREQINNIVTEQRGDLLNKRQALQAIHQKLYNAASGDDYDATEVKQLIEQQSRLAAEITRQQTRIMQKIYREITPQQQARFQSMRHRYRHNTG